MTQKITIISLLIILLGTGYYFNNRAVIAPDTLGPENISVEIDGQMRDTRYFGNEALGDLTGDGEADKAFLVTYDGGGSGTFYYAVVAIKTGDDYQNTNAFFIGDRIAPQSTEISESARELHINYAERRPDEPMTAMPSVGAVKLLKVTADGRLEGLMP